MKKVGELFGRQHRSNKKALSKRPSQTVESRPAEMLEEKAMLSVSALYVESTGELNLELQSSDNVRVGSVNGLVRVDTISPGGVVIPFNGLGILPAQDVQSIVIVGGDDNLSAAGSPIGDVRLIMDAGDGNDTINGGDGDDVLSGGLGNDGLNGRDGNDAVNAGGGNDTVLGGDGNDSLIGGGGSDIVLGEDGSDNVNGQSGTDTVAGNQGADLIADVAAEINETFVLSASIRALLDAV